MVRERLMREIADLDAEINAILGETRIPGVDSRPFPKGSWVLALICFAWYLFGEQLPEVSLYHDKYGKYGLYAGCFFAAFGVIGTLSWVFRRRGGTSPQFRQASEKIKTLQEKRRELQIRLKELED